MNTVGGAISHVSHQLNDQQVGKTFIRWGRADILEYLNEGLAFISGHRPEAIITTETVELVTGRTQTFTGYASILSIRGAVKADAVLSEAFAAYNVCPTKPEFDAAGRPRYAIRSYSIDKDNPKVVYVEPAVPSGVTASVTLTAVTKLVPYTLKDWNVALSLDPKYYNPLLDFMWGRAYELDTESAQSRSNAQIHMRAAYTALGLVYKMDSAHRSGFYLGQTGDGDPRARVG